MKDSLNTLKELASSVRNATKEGENSAERIGRLFEGILEYIKTPESIENYFELKQDSNGLDYIYTKYNIASAGALSMYASDKINVPSIYDGLPIDNDTIYWHEVDGSKVLKAKGGGGEAGSVQWDNISGKPLWIEDTKPSYSWSDITGEKPFYTKEEIASKYVTIDTEQEITALKHFTAGLSVGESKKKIYEENGVVYIDADVAVTGAMTFYASAGRSVSTIMDGVTVDEETITKGSDNVLRIKNAGAGSSFDENAMWSALSGSSDNQINKSHLTNALAGYATESWVTGKGYATESWVASKNYATTEALNAVSNKLNDFLEGSDADTIINKWKELEAFLSGMAETDNLAEILKTKADRSYVDSTFVTLSTKQTITGEKTFSSVLNTAAIKASGAITAPSLAVSDWVTIAGIKLRKLEDGALMLEGNLALTGALTMYASNGKSFDTIYDGLPIDNDTIYWQEVDGSRVLKAREGSGSSFDKSAMWTALAGSTTEQINKSHLTTALTGYATESWVTGKGYITSSALNGYATESWVTSKNYAVKATTLAGYGITDGINAVSVTGTGNAVTAASISGHTLTLTKGSTFLLSSQYTASDILAKLKTVDGSGSGLDADMLNGYKRVHTTGSGNKAYYRLLTLEIKGGYTNTPVTFELCGRSSTKACFVSISFSNGPTNDPSLEGFYYFGDNRYGRYLRLYKTATSTWELWMKQQEESYDGCDVYNIKPTSNILITINSGGSDSLPTSSTYKDCELGGIYGNLSGNANTATKLQTARTLWGRSFDGTGNVNGNLEYVPSIINQQFYHRLDLGYSGFNQFDFYEYGGLYNFYKCTTSDASDKLLLFKISSSYTYIYNKLGIGISSPTKALDVNGSTGTTDLYINGIRLHKTADGVITLEGNLAVTGGVTMYAIDPVSASTIMDGVVVDGVTIKKENGKLVAVGGGEAGSVAWGNISGKPSVFATNIANITDLHSSWDSVLAAQKPAWLTAVSIATISDLHANWDALLKAAPSAYVTRWPTITEVTGKKNLIVKLNGGTTEGTNQFTYNATGAKTINITPAGIGAAASSHSHNAISASLTGTNALNMVYAQIADNDYFRLRVGGTASNAGYVEFATADDGNEPIYFRQYTGTFTTVKRTLTLLDGSGNSSFPGTVTAPTFNGKLAWSNVTSKPTTLSGYGITDAPTKTGGGASGTWGIGITGNAGSATKLQTAQKIWGQLFDGTKPVTGDMSGVGTIYGSNGLIIRDSLDNWIIGKTSNSSGISIGSNALDQPININNKNGNIYLSGNGNVGIGTTRSSYKLHVNGVIYSTNDVKALYYTLNESPVTGTGSSDMFTSGTSSIKFLSDTIAVNGGTFRPIIRWGDQVSGRGYTTRYIFGSVRDNANYWGRIFMAVSNNDPGTSTGCSFSIYGGGYVEIGGDLLVSGGSTFYSSDIRYKSIIQQVKLSLLEIANAPSFVYHWNREGMKCDRLNLGGSAQYTQKILPWAVENNNNLLSMDYATVAYTFAVHTARHLMNYESKTDKKIKKLENRVKYLEKQLKS